MKFREVIQVCKLKFVVDLRFYKEVLLKVSIKE